MEEKIANLNESQNFVFVNLGISDEDLKLVDQFKINFCRQYNRFGNLDLLQDELPRFLRSIGNNEESLVQTITQIIYKIASHVSKASHKETAWVCIRASTANQAFNVPRWHWDGYYYFPYSGFVFKFVAVLKGNPTLFCHVEKNLRETFKAHSGDREFLKNLLYANFISSPKSGEGAFFLVGDTERAAIHSDPKIESERLFFSVLPGDKNEIEDLNTRFN